MSIYFISDLHISTLADSRKIVDLLTHFEQDPDLEAIFLVGDVFEFNLGYDHLLFDCYFPLIAKFDQLIQKKINIHLFSGNHDPGINPIFSQIGVQCYDHPIDLTFKNLAITIHIEHGDLIDDAKMKKALCLFVRHPWVQALAKCIPAQSLFALIHQFSSVATQRTQAPKIQETIISKIEKIMAKNDLDLWIMGHFHRLLHQQCGDHQQRQIFVLGDGILYMSYLKLSLDQGLLEPMIKQIKSVNRSQKISADHPHKQSVNTQFKAQIYRYLNDKAQPYPLGDHDF
jgi:UDP-2,3-diacylglucosamine hydrolase